MLAESARTLARINATAIANHKFSQLKEELDSCIDAAVDKGHFQVLVHTNAPQDITREITQLLVAGKFDVKVEALVGDYVPTYDGLRATHSIWIGWADDQCEAGKRSIDGSEKVKRKPKPKQKRKTKKRTTRSAPAVLRA